jgi:hypothetical protein
MSSDGGAALRIVVRGNDGRRRDREGRMNKTSGADINDETHTGE